MKNKFINIYDFLLIIFIGSLFFGGIGGGAQPIRIISLCLLPFAIIFYFRRKIKRLQALVRTVFIIYLFLILSLFWTIDQNNGIKEIVYYLCNFSILIEIPFLALKAKNSIKSLLFGWFFFILLTIPIAFYEIIFDNHLALSYNQGGDFKGIAGGVYKKRFASVTFGNYNTYVMVLCMSMPFIFGLLYHIRKFKFHFSVLIVICLSYAILFINASRGGILASVFMGLLFLYYNRGKRIHFKKVKLWFFIPVLSYIILRYSSSIFNQIIYRIDVGSSFTSDLSRFTLFKDGLNAFLTKPLFGGGIGSLDKMMAMQGAFILQPHNLFIEILIEFGAWGGIIFLIFLFRLINRDRKERTIINAILFCAVISLPIIAIINSSYLLQPVLWVFLGSLYTLKFIQQRSYNRL